MAATRALLTLLACTLLALPDPADAAPEAEAERVLLWTEAAGIWQSRNDVAIPASDGTPFSLVDLGTGPVLGGRIYASVRVWKGNELRLLYAPFTLRQEGRYPMDIAFMGETFAADEDLETLYRFNSYRLTWRLPVLQGERTTLKVGFTGKIRDAEIGLAQGGQAASRTNVGFVPLLHLALDHRFTDALGILLDADGLWSPYGRAEDVALMGTFQFHPRMRGLVGYRTVEGGSDGGGDVFTFSWLHFATLGLQVWR